MLLSEHKNYYFGNEALDRRGILSLNYPIKNGIVQDWDAMIAFCNQIFSELNMDPSKHPILLTEPPHNPKENRERMIQILFEEYNVPASYVALQSLLGVYALGRTVSLVIDIGDSVTHVFPVFEGHVCRAAVDRVNFGGKNVTEYLMNLVNQQGHSFKSTAEFEIIKDMKEKLAYVAPTYNTEIAKPSNYELPDGQVITLTDEKYQCAEILFSPYLVGSHFGGLHEMVFNSIMKCDMDTRRDFFCNISTAGGSSMMPGLEQRLKHELNLLVPKAHRAHVVAGSERKYASWIGGSIMSSLSTFQQYWISKEEYDEIGPDMANRKGFNAQLMGPEKPYQF